MADVFSSWKRSEIMSAVRGRNTVPELKTASTLRRMGFRVQRHRRTLPGTPDIVLPNLKIVVLLNGCLWHGHKGCRRAGLPSTNRSFWKKKVAGNMRRDRRQLRELRRAGWKPLVLWTCRKIDDAYLRGRLRRLGVVAPVNGRAASRTAGRIRPV